MTVDEFATAVGLTPRTVRSYHARGLLPPPSRTGRKPFYSRIHLLRMQTIIRMQDEGLPLEAIRALMDPDRVIGQYFLPTLRMAAILRRDPELLDDLIYCGVLIRQPDGHLSVSSARAIMASQAVAAPDVSLARKLSILAAVVQAVAPLAKDALAQAQEEILQRVPDIDQYRDGIVELAVEALRIGINRSLI